jgi:hypothetical protein
MMGAVAVGRLVGVAAGCSTPVGSGDGTSVGVGCWVAVGEGRIMRDTWGGTTSSRPPRIGKRSETARYRLPRDRAARRVA